MRACVFLEGKRRRFSSPHLSLSLSLSRSARARKRDKKKTHNNVIQTASRASTRKQTLAKSVTEEEEEEEAPISFHSRRRAQTTLVPFKKQRLSTQRERERRRRCISRLHPKKRIFKLDKIVKSPFLLLFRVSSLSLCYYQLSFRGSKRASLS